jgi:hypothetical protein
MLGRSPSKRSVPLEDSYSYPRFGGAAVLALFGHNL